MDIGRAFSFVFQDPAWIRKILLLAVMFFIPIIGWLIIGGYTLRLIKNVIDGVPQPLPEWDNWGGDLGGGLKVLVVGIVWGIPIWIITAVLDSGDSWLLGFVSWLLSVGWSAVQMSAMGDLARAGNIADAFSMKVVNRVLNNFPIWIVYILGTFVFGIFALIGLIGLIIGIVITASIAIAATAHLGGQAYRLSEGAAVPAQPRF